MAEQQATINCPEDARLYLAADANSLASLMLGGIPGRLIAEQQYDRINGRVIVHQLGLPVTSSLGTGTVRLSAARQVGFGGSQWESDLLSLSGGPGRRPFL
jgi:hypothetical protein